MKKTLILHNGEYKKFDTTWQTVSQTLPTKEQFLSNGMDSISPLLDLKVQPLPSLQMSNKSEILSENSEGKVFSKTLDLNKYIDIRSINVEVK